MAQRRKPADPPKRRSAPARTPEERENELIGLSADLAEKQLRAGTASSQVMTHFLKLGSTREALEQERLRNENLKIEAQIEQMASVHRIEELYGEAINAMRLYNGQEPLELPDEEDIP